MEWSSAVVLCDQIGCVYLEQHSITMEVISEDGKR